MNQIMIALVTCASGGGSQFGISMPALCVSASGVQLSEEFQTLQVAVTFGSLDAVGAVFAAIPDPSCQIVGHMLSLPSRIMWIRQCIRLHRMQKEKPK